MRDGKTKKQFVDGILDDKSRKSLFYVLFFVLSSLILYVFIFVIDNCVSGSFDKKILEDVLLAVGGGVVGAMCYGLLENIGKKPIINENK